MSPTLTGGGSVEIPLLMLVGALLMGSPYRMTPGGVEVWRNAGDAAEERFRSPWIYWMGYWPDQHPQYRLAWFSAQADEYTEVPS